MSTVLFDTHAFYVELVESGLAEKTADALTKAVTKIELAKLEDLATKRDLKELELKIAQLDTKMSDTKADLIRWVIGVGLLQIAIIAALMLRLTGKA
ncbi:MAG: DUF1640 domain-containing protein [Methylococcales bacterium]|nr:DUF1640 domain-containing protein [Methylococcales bacterium]